MEVIDLEGISSFGHDEGKKNPLDRIREQIAKREEEGDHPLAAELVQPDYPLAGNADDYINFAVMPSGCGGRGW